MVQCSMAKERKRLEDLALSLGYKAEPEDTDSDLQSVIAEKMGGDAYLKHDSNQSVHRNKELFR